MGAVVYYDYERESDGFAEFKTDQTWRENLAQPGSAFMRGWLGIDFFAKVVLVEFPGNEIEEENWAKTNALRDLPDIETVLICAHQETGPSRETQGRSSLRWAAIGSDALFENLSSLPRLRTLTISGINRHEFLFIEGLDVIRGPGPVFADLSENKRRSLGRMKSLENVHLFGVTLDDESLRQVSKLPKLGTLSFSLSEIGNAELASIATAPELRELRIMFAGGITDTRLAGLEHARKLECLVLSYAPITDEGLVHFKALPNLREIDLTGTRLTNAAIPKLASLSALETVNLEGTEITVKGLTELRERRPNLNVILASPKPDLKEEGGPNGPSFWDWLFPRSQPVE